MVITPSPHCLCSYLNQTEEESVDCIQHHIKVAQETVQSRSQAGSRQQEATPSLFSKIMLYSFIFSGLITNSNQLTKVLNVLSYYVFHHAFILLSFVFCLLHVVLCPALRVCPFPSCMLHIFGTIHSQTCLHQLFPLTCSDSAYNSVHHSYLLPACLPLKTGSDLPVSLSGSCSGIFCLALALLLILAPAHVLPGL